MSNKTYFVSGANKGIGFAIVKALSATPTNFIIATARNPDKATDLKELASKNGNIAIVQLDVTSVESIDALPTVLDKKAPTGIDYLISNAGIGLPEAYQSVLKAPDSVWLDHYKTNTLGPIRLFKKLYPYLLKRSTRVVYFVSSSAGSLTNFIPLSTSAYGQSKAALNFTIKTLAFELQKENFIVVAIHPGLIITDLVKAIDMSSMDNLSPEMNEALQSTIIDVDESAEKQVGVINGLTKEDNGKFLNWDGTEAAW